MKYRKRKLNKYEQTATTIRESINVDISEADKKVQIIYATADANAIRIINDARSQAINTTITYEKLAYRESADLLGLSANDGLLDYISLLNIIKNRGSQLLVGLQNNVILNLSK